MTALELADRLAAVNAGLNATATVLILLGWRAIRRGERERHPRFMAAALACSALFLVSYVTRMLLSGTHRFEGPEGLRAFYLLVLATHVVLAAAVPPLVGTAVWLALKGRLAAHVKVVRWALPIWLYVSATGVLIFVLLYGFGLRAPA